MGVRVGDRVGGMSAWVAAKSDTFIFASLEPPPRPAHIRQPRNTHFHSQPRTPSPMISPNPHWDVHQPHFESPTASDARLKMGVPTALRDNNDENVILHELRDDVFHSINVDYTEQRDPWWGRRLRLHGCGWKCAIGNKKTSQNGYDKK